MAIFPKHIRMDSNEFAEYLNNWDNSPFTFTTLDKRATYIGAKVLLTVNPNRKGKWIIIIRENSTSKNPQAYAFAPENPEYKEEIRKLFDNHGWDCVIVNG